MNRVGCIFRLSAKKKVARSLRINASPVMKKHRPCFLKFPIGFMSIHFGLKTRERDDLHDLRGVGVSVETRPVKGKTFIFQITSFKVNPRSYFTDLITYESLLEHTCVLVYGKSSRFHAFSIF